MEKIHKLIAVVAAVLLLIVALVLASPRVNNAVAIAKVDAATMSEKTADKLNATQETAKVPAETPKATQTPKPTPTPKPDTSFQIKMTFAGDCIITTYKNQSNTGSFNEAYNKNSGEYFLKNMKETFEKDDWTIVNLENVLTDRPLKEAYKDYSPAYWYKGPTSHTDVFTSSSVEGVTLSNNHTGDYGKEGAADTVEAVKKAKLNYGTSTETMYFTKNNFTVAVVCRGLWGEYHVQGIIDKMNEAAKHSDYQVLFLHGGTERVHAPEKWRIKASHTLVDNGADLIIESHPHVIQPREIYKGVNIFYSMGNFCFGDEKRAENRTILCQQTLTIDNGKVQKAETNIVPCYVYTAETNNYCPALITDKQEIQNVLDFMDWKRDTPK